MVATTVGNLQDRFGVSRMGAWKAIWRALDAGLVRPGPTPQGEVFPPAAFEGAGAWVSAPA